MLSATAQTIVLTTEQVTVKSGTHNESTLGSVKFTTEHLTILELLGGIKSYDYLPPGGKMWGLLQMYRLKLQCKSTISSPGNGNPKQ